MRKLYIILIFILLLASCKKEPRTILINGSVTDKYTLEAVSGAKVLLQANGIVDGVYSSSFATLESKITDSQGNFSFEIKESSYDSYRFKIEKNGYYDEMTVYGSNSFSAKDINLDFKIMSKAFVRLQFKNVNPCDENDKMVFFLQNNPINELYGGYTDARVLHGVNVDTSFLCNTAGGFDLILRKELFRNGVYIIKDDTFKTIPLDTVKKEVFY